MSQYARWYQGCARNGVRLKNVITVAATAKTVMSTTITRACAQSGWRSARIPSTTALAYMTARRWALASGTMVHVNQSSEPGARVRLSTAATAFATRNSSTNFTQGSCPDRHHSRTRM